MTSTEKRDAVLQRYVLPGRSLTFNSGGPLIEQNRSDVGAMADRIVALEAAVARVRAVHNPDIDAPCDYCAPGGIGPCPTLTALEGIA